MARDILPPTVVEALQGGNKIEAIKRLRGITGLGLKEAKDWIEVGRDRFGGRGGDRGCALLLSWRIAPI